MATTEQQLTLPMTYHTPSLFTVNIYRNGTRLASTKPDSFAGSNNRRRSLVNALQRANERSTHPTMWEEDPRSTGWFGLKSDGPHGSAVFHLTVERV